MDRQARRRLAVLRHVEEVSGNVTSRGVLRSQDGVPLVCGQPAPNTVRLTSMECIGQAFGAHRTQRTDLL